jgi:MoxR-like ATPase
MPDTILPLALRLRTSALDPLKATFIGKDEVVDLLGISVVCGENVFLLGPPGTAKTALVHALARRIEGRAFDYLLTRFTEPGELFGPFDLRRLREGDLVTNTEGMLPEADLVFLDELLNANSAILNSLLMALNERVFRRGRETRGLPALAFIGASNHLPEDDALKALFDRFPLRVRCDNAPDEALTQVLEAGWKLELAKREPAAAAVTAAELRAIQAFVPQVDLLPARPAYAALVTRIRRAGMAFSDRRAVRLQRAVAGSALLAGRAQARVSDLWVLRHAWDTLEQCELLNGLVEEALREAPEDGADHPRARPQTPDAEALAAELEALAAPGAPEDAARRRDRLALAAGRVPWVANQAQRAALQARVEALWKTLA